MLSVLTRKLRRNRCGISDLSFMMAGNTSRVLRSTAQAVTLGTTAAPSSRWAHTYTYTCWVSECAAGTSTQSVYQLRVQLQTACKPQRKLHAAAVYCHQQGVYKLCTCASVIVKAPSNVPVCTTTVSVLARQLQNTQSHNRTSQQDNSVCFLLSPLYLRLHPQHQHQLPRPLLQHLQQFL